jgi:acetyl esterase/lipase
MQRLTSLKRQPPSGCKITHVSIPVHQPTILFFKNKLLESRLPEQALETKQIPAEWTDTVVSRPGIEKVILLLHGGAYVLGSAQLYRWLTFPIAVHCKAKVLGKKNKKSLFVF